MSTTRAPDPARRNPQVTAAILEAALAMAREDGLARVSIEGIAARAGVGKRTIYRWWPSKGAVVLDAWAQRLEERLHRRLEATQTDDFEADLKLMVKDAWIDTIGDTRGVLASIVAEAQHDPDLAAEFRKRLISPASALVAERIRRAQADGQVAADIDPYRAIELIYAQLYYRLLIVPGPHDEAYVNDVADLAMRGLRP
ncbi:TetR/AcrR family transcriptional regulator [Streptosporangium saharense]|uniref:AcrR family transcriptional regulator n=2 Tax=Streptosporangium saharense TaxID=1706840 RepID=A0A7W7QPJ0_9ACTN|nr:TetR/AcrR family transcriptional regulator [Streptosporangium saharense]MBB4917298.1 AcrR family transcriptional regulator [Streptosporangium saharense]